MSTKGKNNSAAAGQARPEMGTELGVGYRNFAAGRDGASLFQRLLQAEAAGDRRRRRHSAVRARASARFPPVSAEPVARNHAAISRANDSCAEALELRSGHDG